MRNFLIALLFAALARASEVAGVDHAFTVFGGQRYDEKADKKSWKRCTAFLEEVFGKVHR